MRAVRRRDFDATASTLDGFRLEGKFALVTGSTTGIGLDMAAAMAGALVLDPAPFDRSNSV